MKKKRLFTLFLKKKFFDLVVAGKKTIEVRVGYPNLSGFKAGMKLQFICGKQFHTVTVVRRSEYPTFKEMLDHEDYKKMNPYRRSKEEQLASIMSIYSPEKEKKYGVVIFEIKV